MAAIELSILMQGEEDKRKRPSFGMFQLFSLLSYQ